MGSGERALVAHRALARSGEDRDDPVARAEARLAAALADATALDLELEALSAALGDFARRYERAVAVAFAELGGAERLVRRLQRLEDELARLAERYRAGDLAPAPRRRASRRAGRPAARDAGAEDAPRGGDAAAGFDDAADADAGGAAEPGGDGAGDGPAPELEDDEAVLKRLFRRLARVLHPDLARDPAEAARLGELMARVNAAYARRDRTALEVMVEKVGAGEPPGDLSPEERLAHLERRTATLERIVASLRRERDRLLRTDTHRLREEALRREAAGGDWLAETAAALADEAGAAYADALARLGRLVNAARELSRARKGAMSKIVKRGPTGARRAFDPLTESELVRRGAVRLERQRATARARELARALEDAASAAPWEAALTVLAFLVEAAGARPPDAVATPGGLAARWDALRAAWPDAPDLSRALARLPRHLEVGLRDGTGEVVAGLQLADPELAAGVRIALDREAVARLARDVLAALGPDERCPACRDRVVAVHLLRTRGLDELNGLACPRCGAILRSYWRYGEAEGLEALAPYARSLGLVAEQPVRLATATIGFQMLPAERERLTAGALRRRFAELYLAPYEVDLAPERLRVEAGGAALAPTARVAGVRGLAIGVEPDAGTTPEALLELLRARIERRFRT